MLCKALGVECEPDRVYKSSHLEGDVKWLNQGDNHPGIRTNTRSSKQSNSWLLVLCQYQPEVIHNHDLDHRGPAGAEQVSPISLNLRLIDFSDPGF